jgi:hypothetical protein
MQLTPFHHQPCRHHRLIMNFANIYISERIVACTEDAKI